jgi:hypothetical protein
VFYFQREGGVIAEKSSTITPKREKPTSGHSSSFTDPDNGDLPPWSGTFVIYGRKSITVAV